jgi:regulation of enolase protein 1 (concanavalin A-like superfamily)
MQRRTGYLRVCALVGALAAQGAIAGLSAQSALPSPWVGVDIGTPLPAGMSSFDDQQFTLIAGGIDIGGRSDQFHFVCQQVAGDVDIVARVDSLTAADPWSKAGVMIRADLSASSPYAFALVSGANGVAFQRRSRPRGVSSMTMGDIVAAPRWVRLRRVGTTITGYSSDDGGTWQALGSAVIAIGQSVYVGFAVTSHNPGSAASATFSQSSLSGTVTTSVLPGSQQTSDIGAPAVAGSATYAQGLYTVTGAGTDIWGTSDQFRFVYQAVTGDVDIAVHVGSVQNVNSWTKAGVMVRESLDGDSRHAMALISAGQGYSFQWRLDTGGLADYRAGGAGSVPTWIRLVRTGYRFEAFRSTDGSSWTSMGVETVPMADTVYAGLAVTSHKASRAATAVFDRLTVTQSSSLPRLVEFQASSDHATLVTSYRLDVFANGANPDSAAPIATSDLGKPAPDTSGQITVDRSSLFDALVPGTYLATVSAVGTDGASRSAPTTFVR